MLSFLCSRYLVTTVTFPQSHSATVKGSVQRPWLSVLTLRHFETFSSDAASGQGYPYSVVGRTFADNVTASDLMDITHLALTQIHCDNDPFTIFITGGRTPPSVNHFHLKNFAALGTISTLSRRTIADFTLETFRSELSIILFKARSAMSAAISAKCRRDSSHFLSGNDNAVPSTENLSTHNTFPTLGRRSLPPSISAKIYELSIDGIKIDESPLTHTSSPPQASPPVQSSPKSAAAKRHLGLGVQKHGLGRESPLGILSSPAAICYIGPVLNTGTYLGKWAYFKYLNYNLVIQFNRVLSLNYLMVGLRHSHSIFGKSVPFLGFGFSFSGFSSEVARETTVLVRILPPLSSHVERLLVPSSSSLERPLAPPCFVMKQSFKRSRPTALRANWLGMSQATKPLDAPSRLLSLDHVLLLLLSICFDFQAMAQNFVSVT